MLRLSRACALVVFALLAAAPARAQIAGEPWEISGNAGWMSFDHRAYLENNVTFGGSFGRRLAPWLVAEAYGQWAPSKADTGYGPERNFSTLGTCARATAGWFLT